jgi:heme oxygenase
MPAGRSTARADDRSDQDVLRRLRSGTAAEHAELERTLDLLDPGLQRGRLIEVLRLMHGFWLTAEAGLDEWARAEPADAESVRWPDRRRAALFADDLGALGAAALGRVAPLPPVTGTDEAFGRLYVLEGSTLGGAFIDRHLAGLPGLSAVRLRAFSPYGDRTGAMWAAFRRAARTRVAAGGQPATMVASARGTFRALAAWCTPPQHLGATA